jgi:uncharacterized SAM-binding protein YcdF (DUF218 family)
LGARLNPQGLPGRVARARLLHALELWRHWGQKSYLILTGSRTGGAAVSEAQAMAAFARNWVDNRWGPEFQEVLHRRLLLEEASHNTAASARHTLKLVRNLNLRTVGLVSDRLHIHRAYYIFRRHFARHQIVLHPAPAPGVLQSYWQQRRYLRVGKMVLREGGAWVKTLFSP